MHGIVATTPVRRHGDCRSAGHGRFWALLTVVDSPNGSQTLFFALFDPLGLSISVWGAHNEAKPGTAKSLPHSARQHERLGGPGPTASEPQAFRVGWRSFELTTPVKSGSQSTLSASARSVLFGVAGVGFGSGPALL